MNLLAAAAETASPSWFTGAAMGLGVLALTVVSLRIWMKNRRRVRALSNGPGPRDRLDALALTQQRDSIESLIVDLQETARSCAAQVENRAARLEALMRQTDAKLADLKATLAASENVQSRVQSRAAAPASTGNTGSLRIETERDARTRRVIDLHRNGNSPEDIARATGEDLGKVQLIISLHAAGDESRATA